MPKIVIYSTATCAYCKMLKSYLQSKNIEYEEKHADLDQTIAQELFEKSGQLGVPFTLIENDEGVEEKILGFERTERFANASQFVENRPVDYSLMDNLEILDSPI